ncbi:peroxiredoxin-like family protein [Kangiella sp. TOML190]|uniref:peroxiredoxin-like family protein n=1 Tax=Kangiella sp. TOML190 TaxID=2931351 RepID=UPI00203DFC0B|nr:peroxiredoxin-like family protein [Kangiella sp. TOML190]
MKTISYLIIALMIGLASFVASAEQKDFIAEMPTDIRPLLIGETIPEVTLFDAAGSPVNLRQLAAKKPTVILFYRGGWCPFCNAQLSQLQEIEKDLIELGYQLVAISPDTPDALKKSISERKLKYQLISDFNLQATRQFGLAFYIPKTYSNKVKAIGGKTQTLAGDERSILPVPAAFVLDTQGVIQFEYINPNYKVRIKPELLLDAARYALEKD